MSVPSPVNESLLSQRLGALGSARSWAPNVLPELERFIRTADDYDLFRVNPIQYGGGVDLSEADAIELFVHAGGDARLAIILGLHTISRTAATPPRPRAA